MCSSIISAIHFHTISAARAGILMTAHLWVSRLWPLTHQRSWPGSRRFYAAASTAGH